MSHRTVPRTVVVGMAGIAWRDLMTRVGQRGLPSIEAVIRRGGAMRLIDDVPHNSVASWATLTSGAWPEDHRIVLPDAPWAGGLRPAGHDAWHRAPAWRRFSDAGYRTASVAWPLSSPGAAWPGMHVDTRFAHATGASWADWYPARDAGPPGLVSAFEDLRVHPAEVDPALMRPFVPALEAVDQRTDRGLIDLAMMLARLSTNHAIAQELIARDDWDVLFLHYEWIAAITAAFPDAAAPYEHVVDAAWTIVDTLIATILAGLPGDGTLILVSPGRAGEDGVLALCGPEVKAGMRAGVAHSIDLVPTLLAHHGLFDAALPGRDVLRRAMPLQPAPADQTSPMATHADAATLVRVAAFGHAPPVVPPEWHAAHALILAGFALPRAPARAAYFARRALAATGDRAQPIGLLALAEAAEGRFDDFPALADRIAACAPGHTWEALIRGGYHAARGEASAARPHLMRVEAEGGRIERLRTGAAWLMLARPAEARRVFDGVLAADASDVDALIGLAMATLTEPLKAEQTLRTALAVDPANTPARTLLVDILRNLGRHREADAVQAAGGLFAA